MGKEFDGIFTSNTKSTGNQINKKNAQLLRGENTTI